MTAPALTDRELLEQIGREPIGRYRVLEVLGRGGTGIVFKAQGPGGLFAIKVLRPDALAPDALDRFERERALLSSFSSDAGFVPLVESGSTSLGPYFVMPYLARGTLRHALDRSERLPIAETIELGRTLAAALGRAHARNVVHRDMKPENVLFSDDGRPLVADLGLAKLVQSAAGASTFSRSGELRGTPGYMAPEQAGNSRDVTPAADVFAMGAILYECLAGRQLFEGDTPLEVIAKTTVGFQGSIAAVRPDVPRGLARIVDRCLATDPARRFLDAAALARALGGLGVTRTYGWLAAALAGAAVGALVTGALLGRGSPAPPAVLRPDPPVNVPRPEAEMEFPDDGVLQSGYADVTAAIAREPGRALLWLRRGNVLIALKRPGPAIDDYTRAIELDPKLAVAWERRAAARLGLLEKPGVTEAERTLELESGIADCDRAIELSPGVAAAHFYRGYIRGTLKPGDVEACVLDFTRAVELRPGYQEAWRELGFVAMRSGDFVRARECLAKATALDPWDWLAWAGKGQARLGDRDLAGALEDAKKALELNPGYPYAENVRRQAEERLGR